MPAADCGVSLLFDERNVNAECPRCNAFDSTHLLGYAEGLDERYGKGTALALRALRDLNKLNPQKDLSKDEYTEKIRELQKR